MGVINISNGLSLSVGKAGKKLRLIVYTNGVENVCRKESARRLSGFIISNEQKLFNSRLQLIKNSEHIVVQVKGEIAGMINGRDLLFLIDAVNGESI